MRLLYLIILTSFLTSCFSSKEANQDNQIWNDFVSKIEDRDVEYLINNSLDFITCINCTENDNRQLHSSELIFNKYLDNLYKKGYLKKRDYSVFQDSIKIRISYLDDKKLFNIERSSIVYMFDLHEGKYMFSGMITIP